MRSSAASPHCPRGLAALPARLPEMRSYVYGRDLGIVEGNGDFAVVAEFDDEAAWQVYQKDEEHRRVIEQLIVPVTAERHAVQLRHP